ASPERGGSGANLGPGGWGSARSSATAVIEPSVLCEQILQADDHGLRTDQVLDVALTEPCLGHPAPAVRTVMVAGASPESELIAAYADAGAGPRGAFAADPARGRDLAHAGRVRRARQRLSVARLAGIGSARAAREGAAWKGSAKYWVSCDTRPSVNSMMLTEWVVAPS
ncbi:MAG: hypothetical protein QOE32_3813, partial [Pseudonocardiales bacterium]|nr:hypothetical protein [Pseudonocardiales bacterium]